MLRTKLIKTLKDMERRNYLIACTPLLGVWVINTGNWNCSFMSINLTWLVLLKPGVKSYITGILKQADITF